MERSQDFFHDGDGDPVAGGISYDSGREAYAARVTRPPIDDATQIRAFAEQSDTESVWVEPNLLPGNGVITAGSILGNRYLLDYVLGDGGIGVVYRATDQEVTGETFAIKVLKPEIRKHAGALKLLREEVRKTRALRHPSIVGVYSLNSDPGGIYMLMEYLEGKSLNALLDEEFGRGMPPMRAWPLIHDVGSALAYAHDHNVIHSDLKPSNIFVTTSGKAKLLDFGIARAVRVKADRFDPGVLGALTPAYASLEMLQGNAPDQSDDVYSFACVIYETLSGRHPFDRMSALDARGANLRPAPLASLTRGQNKALARALAFPRAERTRSVEALLAGLKGMSEGSRISPAVLASATVVCVALGLAAWLALRTSTPKNLPTDQTATVRASAASTSGASTIARDTSVEKSAPPLPAVLVPPPAAVESPRPEKPVVPMVSTGSMAEANKEIPPGNREATGNSVSRATLGIEQASAEKIIPSTVPATAATTPVQHPGKIASQGDIDHPPVGKNIPAIVLTAESAETVNNCPYPEEARREVQTGSVVLLVYVAADGDAYNTRIDRSSGWPVLDAAAANCVQAHGQFAVRLVGKQAVPYWGRMRFNWSVGG
jgi:TonB family protein